MPQPPHPADRLARLRRLFLDGTGGRAYWESDDDLDAYDRTFGARIGWKWDWVLAELTRRGWRPPAGEILDWGCGSGVAARAVLRACGDGAVTAVRLWDHSPLAVQAAAQKIAAGFPAVAVGPMAEAAAAGRTLLVSHVLTELSGRDRDALIERAQKAAAVLWVEPGTREAAQLLAGVRERLARHFVVAAPCPAGTMPCPLLDPANARHWCHHFAPPPAFVFTDPFWTRFGREAGIDLRSLPLSFLALQRAPLPPLPAGTLRLLGRPRLEKGAVRVLACGAEGLHDLLLSRREHPELFRQARKGGFPSLLCGMT